MKFFSPAYYGKFKCLAKKCRNSCCIGWEISVDTDTLDLYRGMGDCGREILSLVDTEGDTGTIRLDSDGRCPFLDSSGLCKVISSHGEGCVSKICQRHPRFYHRVGDVVECGIGAVCEEAARLILTSEDYTFGPSNDECTECADETDFNTFALREEVYSILRSSLSHKEKLRELSDMYGLSEKLYDDGWDAVVSELELLDFHDRELFALTDITNDGIGEYSERFLAYLVFRHVSVAADYDNFRARLGFCLLLNRFFESAVSKLSDASEESCIDIARRLSEEIEYSEDNTDTLIFEFESSI